MSGSLCESDAERARLIALPPGQATGGRHELRCRPKVGGVDAGDAGIEETKTGCPLAGIEAVPARQVAVAQALRERLERGGAVHWHRRLLSPAVTVHDWYQSAAIAA